MLLTHDIQSTELRNSQLDSSLHLVFFGNIRLESYCYDLAITKAFVDSVSAFLCSLFVQVHSDDLAAFAAE